MATILIDTGPLYAMADRDDDRHHRVVTFLESSQDALVVPATVLPEAAYLLERHLGAAAERKRIQSVVNGELAVEELTSPRLSTRFRISSPYEEARIGFVDATVALAERLKISRI